MLDYYLSQHHKNRKSKDIQYIDGYDDNVKAGHAYKIWYAKEEDEKLVKYLPFKVKKIGKIILSNLVLLQMKMAK